MKADHIPRSILGIKLSGKLGKRLHTDIFRSMDSR